jgi:MFS family permease
LGQGSALKTVPAAVWRLMVAYALMMSGGSLMVMIAGLIGARIAPSPDLATLPITLMVIGVAAATLPTGRLLQVFGRRIVFTCFAAMAILSALLAVWSLSQNTFALFCLAAFLLGASTAAGHQYRFAAIEAVSADQAHTAISILLLGGILSALIGPEMAVRGRHMLGYEFAGSYLLLAGGYMVGLLIVASTVRATVINQDHSHAGRPLRVILRAPTAILSIGAAVAGYGVMSFVMTATPITMHADSGHSLETTKFVIQSHIAAMYLPSLIYSWLFSRLGYRGMMLTGLLLFVICLGIALVDTGFIHFWLALVLLGIGWNFLFVSGTALLPRAYRPEERFRVQSANDFIVFSFMALAALTSGWVLFHWHWQGVIWICVPVLFAFAIVLWRSPVFVDAAGPGHSNYDSTSNN